jgi:HEAT repeat protein
MSSDLILASTSLDPSERRNAIRRLGEARQADGVQSLLFALATADAETAALAVEALVRIGQPAAGPLRAALDQDVDVVVRARLEDALTRLQPKS